MSTPAPLFRAAAIDAQRRQWLGTIVMARAPGAAAGAAAATLMALAVVLFLAFGSYTRRTTVAGRLMPTSGLVRVYASQPGLVVRRLVAEGEHVRQGQPLLEVGSERRTLADGTLQDTQAVVSERVRERSQSYAQQMAQTRLLQAQERQALEARLVFLRGQVRRLEAQIASQRERRAIADDLVARNRSLQAQGFVSREFVAAKRADMLDQTVRLQGLQHEREAAQLELDTRSHELDELGYRQQARLAELERDRSSTQQELLESESRRQRVVVAPQAGVVSTVLIDAGQAVDPSRALLSILPEGAALQAHLYAPSRAIGFVGVGDEVRLRYAAYPYQKFGQARGVVKAIARTALSPAEAGEAVGAAGDAEPLYRITVQLQRQTIEAYGRSWPLQVSMTLEADLLQERRRLYEWFLEPLFALSKKLAA